jgi:protein quaking
VNLKFLIVACEDEWRRLAASAAESRLLSPGMQQIPNQIRAQGTPLGNDDYHGMNMAYFNLKSTSGAPLILSPRMSVPTTAANLLQSQQTLDHSGLIYAAAPFTDYTNYAALAAGNPLLTDYADHTGGLFAR